MSGSFTVWYNNISDRSVGVHAKKRPSIPAPVRDEMMVKIPGRDSAFYETEDTYADIVIPVVFSFLKRDPDDWGDQYRALKKWILPTRKAELRFSDDPEVHYRVLATRIPGTERVTRRIGEVTVEFVCEGYTYLNSGDSYIPFASTIQNAHDLCHPIYKVTGSGTCTIGVNGKSFEVTVNSGATIDSENFITYNTTSGLLANTTVAGDYQDLWLKPGSNVMTISSGFSCQIMPQWRCL